MLIQRAVADCSPLYYKLRSRSSYATMALVVLQLSRADLCRTVGVVFPFFANDFAGMKSCRCPDLHVLAQYSTAFLNFRCSLSARNGTCMMMQLRGTLAAYQVIQSGTGRGSLPRQQPPGCTYCQRLKCAHERSGR